VNIFVDCGLTFTGSTDSNLCMTGNTVCMSAMKSEEKMLGNYTVCGECMLTD